MTATCFNGCPTSRTRIYHSHSGVVTRFEDMSQFVQFGTTQMTIAPWEEHHPRAQLWIRLVELHLALVFQKTTPPCTRSCSNNASDNNNRRL